MDSESAALASAQQKHHKHMMFGKKQRYIEVFQCCGEDMNMVLNGGYQHQSPPAAISKPPLLSSSGMLPVRPQPPQPLQISIPPPLTMPIPPQNSSSLMAQQQAQFIAQQNLIARQQAAAAAQLQLQQQNGMEQMFLQNLGFLSSPSSMGSIPSQSMHSNPCNIPLGQIPQFFYLPQRPMLSMGSMGQMGLMPGMGHYSSAAVSGSPSAYASQAQAHQAAMQHHSQLQVTQSMLPTTNSMVAPSVKRSYDNAFRNDQINLSAAKRAFHNSPSTSNIYGTYPYPQL